MSNPFSRLERYQDSGNEAKENRATECLAACLQLSDEFRAFFISFLYSGNEPDAVKYTSADDVYTQHWIDNDDTENGYLDLLIQSKGRFTIVVENKVGAKESTHQYEKYLAWLKTQRGEGLLCGLVQYPDDTIEQATLKKMRRFRWQDLYYALGEKKKTFTGTDLKVAEAFCDYLNQKGIVMNYTPHDILSYGQGWKAEDALSSVFEAVKDRFDLKEHTYKIVMPKNQWPRLEIGRKSWEEKLFGPGYNNNKVNLYWCVPRIWGCDQKEGSFALELRIWDKCHQNSWNMIQPKLPAWGKSLVGKSLVYTIDDEPPPSSTIKPLVSLLAPPKTVKFWPPNDMQINLSSIKVVDLIDKLEKEVRKHLDMVSDLQ
jgi:hypothetical protein